MHRREWHFLVASTGQFAFAPPQQPLRKPPERFRLTTRPGVSPLRPGFRTVDCLNLRVPESTTHRFPGVIAAGEPRKKHFSRFTRRIPQIGY